MAVNPPPHPVDQDPQPLLEREVGRAQRVRVRQPCGRVRQIRRSVRVVGRGGDHGVDARALEEQHRTRHVHGARDEQHGTGYAARIEQLAGEDRVAVGVAALALDEDRVARDAPLDEQIRRRRGGRLRGAGRRVAVRHDDQLSLARAVEPRGVHQAIGGFVEIHPLARRRGGREPAAEQHDRGRIRCGVGRHGRIARLQRLAQREAHQRQRRDPQQRDRAAEQHARAARATARQRDESHQRHPQRDRERVDELREELGEHEAGHRRARRESLTRVRWRRPADRPVRRTLRRVPLR